MPATEHWFDAEKSLPTEPVGSLPRTLRVQQAVLDFAAGVGEDDLEPLLDDAVRETIERFTQTGSPIITDGEQRRQSFATYLLDPDVADAGEVFAVFADGHHRVIPKLAKAPFAFAKWAADDVRRAREITDTPLKQAVISPSMLSLMYPSDGLPDYSRDEFLDDVVAGCAADIEGAFAAGATRVSIDFTEGRLALRQDIRAPWAGPGALAGFIELINRVLDRLPAGLRDATGVHTCPGNDNDSAHSADVDYADLIPELLQIEAGYFLVQAAGEKDPDRVARLFGKGLRGLPTGRAPRVLLGVTKATSPRLESADDIAEQLVRAARFIPAQQLGSTDDCGFSPYLIDDKPKHGSPDFARDVAFAKIAARVAGTQKAADILRGKA